MTFDLGDTPSLADLCRVESDLALYVAERLAGLVAVHAAVIEIDGTVIVVPGTSYSGKSTLCKAAVEAGHAVLSDEYALIVPQDGTVRGWVRAIRIRQADGSIELIHAVRDHGPVPVDLVASIAFSGWDENPLAVRSLTGGEVAMELLANTVCAQSRPEFALRGVAALARSAPGVMGTRGSAAAAVEELAEVARSARGS